MPIPQIQNDPIINLPSLYKYGLILTNVIGEDFLLEVSEGSCRDANNVIDIEVGSENVEGTGVINPPVIINAAVNGFNGLDTGALAVSTMYSIYMIADSRYYLPTGAIMTLSSNSAPLVPSGYDSMRLIGYWPTDSMGNLEIGFYRGISNDMEFWYAGTDNQILSAGNSTVAANIDLSTVVPPVDDLVISVVTQFTGSVAAQFYQLYNPSFATADFFQYAQVATVPITDQVTVTTKLVVGAPTLNYLVSNAAAALSMWINSFEVSV